MNILNNEFLLYFFCAFSIISCAFFASSITLDLLIIKYPKIRNLIQKDRMLSYQETEASQGDFIPLIIFRLQTGLIYGLTAGVVFGLGKSMNIM